MPITHSELVKFYADLQIVKQRVAAQDESTFSSVDNAKNFLKGIQENDTQILSEEIVNSLKIVGINHDQIKTSVLDGIRNLELKIAMVFALNKDVSSINDLDAFAAKEDENIKDLGVAEEKIGITNKDLKKYVNLLRVSTAVQAMVEEFNTAIKIEKDSSKIDLTTPEGFKAAQDAFVQALKAKIAAAAGVEGGVLKGFDEKKARDAFVDLCRIYNNKGQKDLEEKDFQAPRSWPAAIRDFVVMMVESITVIPGLMRLYGSIMQNDTGSIFVTDSSSKQSAHNHANSFAGLIGEQKEKAKEEPSPSLGQQ